MHHVGKAQIMHPVPLPVAPSLRYEIDCESTVINIISYSSNNDTGPSPLSYRDEGATVRLRSRLRYPPVWHNNHMHV